VPVEPALQTLRLDHFDAGWMAHALTGMRMDVRALERHPFHCTVIRARLGTELLEALELDRPVAMHARFRADRLGIGCTLNAEGSGLLNGLDIPRGSLNIFCEGVEVSYRTPTNFRPSVFWVERERLQAAAVARLGHALTLPLHGFATVPPSYATLALVNLIQDAMRAVDGATPGTTSSDVEPVRNALLNGYVDALAAGIPGRPRNIDRRAQRRNDLMLSIHAFWSANRSEPLDIRALAHATGRAERVLQYTFHDLFGMSPQAWFAVMRLNEAHRELAQAIPPQRTVADIATHWGFNHLGRFARDYRRLFGELPRETLRRSGAEAAVSGAPEAS
jgi:AraC-like DNA-binding protein